MAKLNSAEYKPFEDSKQADENGLEFWYARDLATILEYAKWENFSKVIKRAMLACRNSGISIDDHFPEVRKMVDIGSDAKRKLADYKLTRYACYLIVQNGDPRKEVIALGQTYFAIQTRRQEGWPTISISWMRTTSAWSSEARSSSGTRCWSRRPTTPG